MFIFIKEQSNDIPLISHIQTNGRLHYSLAILIIPTFLLNWIIISLCTRLLLLFFSCSFGFIVSWVELLMNVEFYCIECNNSKCHWYFVINDVSYGMRQRYFVLAFDLLECRRSHFELKLDLSWKRKKKNKTGFVCLLCSIWNEIYTWACSCRINTRVLLCVLVHILLFQWRKLRKSFNPGRAK